MIIQTKARATKFLLPLFSMSILIVTGVLAEPPRLPIAYVIREFDLRVMDALTGDILYEANGSEYDCPESISPDGRWLLYFTSPNSPQNRNYILIDLNTGNKMPLPHTQIDFLDWQPKGFTYFHRPESQELGTIYNYDTKSAQAQPVVTDSHPVYQGMWRQLADEFVFITYYEDQITLHQTGEATLFFPLPAKEISSFSLSPDAQFVAFHGKDKFSDEYTDHVLDLRTGKYAITDDFRVWRPNSHELGYIKSDGKDGKHIAIYDAATEEEVVIVSFGILGSLRWSPKGRYLAYKFFHPGGTDYSSDSLHILDTLTGESTDIAGYISPDAGDMQWVSETILAYTAASADLVQTDSGWQPKNADLWMYDVATNQGRQLTDTPDIHEGLDCMWG